MRTVVGPPFSQVSFGLVSSATAYVGPGDIVGGAIFWFGLRAYSSTTAGTKAIQIVKASDGSAAQDINTLSNGKLDVATIAGLGYAVKVKTLYDQSGNNRHVTQTTLANMAPLTLNVLGLFPACQPDGTTAQTSLVFTLDATFPQPNTIVSCANRTGSTSNFGAWCGFGNNTMYFNNTPNSIQNYCGTSLAILHAPETTDGTTHAIQMLNNGVSSEIYSDGNSLITGDVNTGGFVIGNTLFIMSDIFSNFMTGNWFETGAWNSGFSPGNKAAMNTNIHNYWGF